MKNIKLISKLKHDVDNSLAIIKNMARGSHKLTKKITDEIGFMTSIQSEEIDIYNRAMFVIEDQVDEIFGLINKLINISFQGESDNE